MSAVVREKYEDPVLTNEAIEVHLTYLRSGLDGVQAALPVLRDKIDDLARTVDAKNEKTNDRIDAMNSTLSGKIDRVNSTLSDRIGQVNSTLSERIDQLNSTLSEKIDKVNSDLSARISAITEGLADVRGVVKAMLWVLGSTGALTTLAILAQAARFFGLI